MSKEERECVFGKTEDGAKYVGKINLNKYPDFVQKAIASGLPRESHVARVIGLKSGLLKVGNCSPILTIRKCFSKCKLISEFGIDELTSWF